jgi:hypothetical protein
MQACFPSNRLWFKNTQACMLPPSSIMHQKYLTATTMYIASLYSRVAERPESSTGSLERILPPIMTSSTQIVSMILFGSVALIEYIH